MNFDNWKILILGAGTMGHSIAQVYACAGFKVALVDNNLETLKSAENRIISNLQTLAEFDEISRETLNKAPGLISYFSEYESIASDADLIVETVTENPDIKGDLFSKLDKLCRPDAILTSNTSALNIFDIVNVSHPERLVIFHWCTPPHIMPLVELVKGPHTSEATLEKCRQIAYKLGKKPVIVNQYMPGFIVNRISAAIGREAGYMIEQGWATPEDIDTAITNTFGLRFGFEGHLELFDYIGWDIAYIVSTFLNRYLCSSAAPMPFAKDMFENNRLGVKTGKGLKDYKHITQEEAERIRQRKILKMKRVVREIKEV